MGSLSEDESAEDDDNDDDDSSNETDSSINKEEDFENHEVNPNDGEVQSVTVQEFLLKPSQTNFFALGNDRKNLLLKECSVSDSNVFVFNKKFNSVPPSF